MQFARLRLLLAAVVLGLLVGAAPAHAGPPSYLLLRRTETPTAPTGGHAGARAIEARAHGYAYGYFGACPHPQPERHFGIYRSYTQWSFL